METERSSGYIYIFFFYKSKDDTEVKHYLTLADDWPTVNTASRPFLVTHRRSPTPITMAVMIVVAQLRERNHIVLS